MVGASFLRSGYGSRTTHCNGYVGVLLARIVCNINAHDTIILYSLRINYCFIGELMVQGQNFTVASPLEWSHDTGIPALQSRPLCSRLCSHAVPELRVSETRAAPSSTALGVPPRGRRKCAHCPNNTQTHAPPGRNGVLINE